MKVFFTEEVHEAGYEFPYTGIIIPKGYVCVGYARVDFNPYDAERLQASDITTVISKLIDKFGNGTIDLGLVEHDSFYMTGIKNLYKGDFTIYVFKNLVFPYFIRYIIGF